MICTRDKIGVHGVLQTGTTPGFVSTWHPIAELTAGIRLFPAHFSFTGEYLNYQTNERVMPGSIILLTKRINLPLPGFYSVTRPAAERGPNEPHVFSHALVLESSPSFPAPPWGHDLWSQFLYTYTLISLDAIDLVREWLATKV